MITHSTKVSVKVDAETATKLGRASTALSQLASANIQMSDDSASRARSKKSAR